MDLTDLKSGLNKKTFKQHDPITISYKSDFIICEDMFKKNIVKIKKNKFKNNRKNIIKKIKKNCQKNIKNIMKIIKIK